MTSKQLTSSSELSRHDVCDGGGQELEQVHPGRFRAAVIRRRAWTVQHRESGMATAEYAIAMIAAAGFAGLLIVILKSGPVREMLTSIVQTALGTR